MNKNNIHLLSQPAVRISLQVFSDKQINPEISWFNSAEKSFLTKTLIIFETKNFYKSVMSSLGRKNINKNNNNNKVKNKTYN